MQPATTSPRLLLNPTTSPDPPAIPHYVSDLCVFKERDPQDPPIKCGWCCLNHLLPDNSYVPMHPRFSCSPHCISGFGFQREGPSSPLHHIGQCCLQQRHPACFYVSVLALIPLKSLAASQICVCTGRETLWSLPSNWPVLPAVTTPVCFHIPSQS